MIVASKQSGRNEGCCKKQCVPLAQIGRSTSGFGIRKRRTREESKRSRRRKECIENAEFHNRAVGLVERRKQHGEPALP